MTGSDFAPPVYGTGVSYGTVETLLNEAAGNLRRHSRGSIGQRTTGSMRVVKPNSTSNSPRGAVGLGRRRTVMTDRRRVVVVDQRSGDFITSDGLQLPTKTSRPVSWHPSSHLGHQPVSQSQSQYPLSYMNSSNDFHIFDLPPTPAIYSGYTSPNSTFSPLSVPCTGQDEQYFLDSSSSGPSNRNFEYPEQQHIPSYIDAPSEDVEPGLYSHFDWTNFASNGFERPTIPLTPNFLPIQHPEPTFPIDEAIPYHPLSDSAEEEEGEILCGMGLYDSPDSGKPASFDPQLDNYRSSMMSQLLGSSYRREPTGKGLKLEETWSPPPSDDENDDDNDEDGEGEDDEDAIAKDETCEDSQARNTAQRVGGSQGGRTGPSDFALLNQERINWL